MGFIFYMSAQPQPPEIPLLWSLFDKVDWSDKIKHFFGYAVLGGLAWRSLGEGCPRWKRFWLAVSISAVYGATDEYHQRFTPGRSCDVCDWIADTTGASLGAMILLIGGTIWQRRTSRTKDTK